MFFAAPIWEGLPCPDLLGCHSAGSNAARRRVYVDEPSQLVCFCPTSRRGGRSHILFFAKLLYHHYGMKNIRYSANNH